MVSFTKRKIFFHAFWITLVFLPGCITLDVEEKIVIRYESKPTVVEDTFNIVYYPKDSTSFFSQKTPEAVYTFKFWEPQFFEYEEPETYRIALQNYQNLYWFARVPVPGYAQMSSYYVDNVPNASSEKTKSYQVLNPKEVPVQYSNYRIAAELMRCHAPIDSSLSYLEKELFLYPTTYDAYILYWSLKYEKKGKTPEALAQIEQEMAEVRRNRRDNSELLEAIALTYIYGIGDRRKAYDITRDIPDSYLHRLNLYNRFLMEMNDDSRELSLMTMTEKFPASELTVRMNLSMLLDYISKKNFRERAAIFAENILNKRIASLRAAKVNTYAVRFLFNYYASIDLAKALPYVQEVLRLDYDRMMYDEITMMLFAERFADSPEYSGLAIDLANKVLLSLSEKRKSYASSSIESEVVDSEQACEALEADLKGRANYAIGMAYHRIGDTKNAESNLLRAKDLSISRRAEIFFALAKTLKNTEPERAFDYALKSAALLPNGNQSDWIRNEFSKKELRKWLENGQTLSAKIDAVQQELILPAPNVQLKTLDGSSLSPRELSGNILVYFFWSPKSAISKMLFSELQLLYAKYHARGVSLYAIDTEGNLSEVKENPREYGYSFPFAAPVSNMARDFQISYLPSAVVVQDGKIFYQNFGYQTNFMEKLEAELQQLLRLKTAQVEKEQVDSEEEK
ncbi:alkyl hydroperoxide reductase/ Thiol specific antioxidant/ Mal allergen [Chloroherpeton thalassium ATCC 35110]|uniref:Alkyl hydroperoxide reductase/ Thiol specific antioxidant/ Mal allergen n=1 Tax=Chloroherpeton thalassium (strain ATCC 35110 / GB-78) TaxID=517418 RepID=B3QW92_CHLT3|nr:TlpA disulfide reductase family protein [Chloroherpeton thalassium]ACF13205.1 alkyl hydroperoxide reductase/ Thiol specific antioxidant/ Mal allergen [Chloroherpeton thalassium ATCC 35110]